MYLFFYWLIFISLIILIFNECLIAVHPKTPFYKQHIIVYHFFSTANPLLISHHFLNYILFRSLNAFMFYISIFLSPHVTIFYCYKSSLKSLLISIFYKSNFKSYFALYLFNTLLLIIVVLSLSFYSLIFFI